jgi:hemerythrin-like domain-containing protein
MPDAIEMLREDHHKVKELFQAFERSDERREKERIAEQTLHELEVHTALEEQIFYPAAQEQVDEKERIHEAIEEHHVAKLLLGELRKMSPDDKHFDAKYKVLAESVKHHIQDEEWRLLPQLEDTLDAERIGQRMEARKQKLEQSSAAALKRRKTPGRARTVSKRTKARRTTKKKTRRR